MGKATPGRQRGTRLRQVTAGKDHRDRKGQRSPRTIGSDDRHPEESRESKTRPITQRETGRAGERAQEASGVSLRLVERVNIQPI